MEVSKLSSPNLLFRPFSPAKQGRKRSYTVLAMNNGGSGGRDYGGRLVDEDMIVLRLRMREARALEVCNNPPSDWMEWEKDYFADYKYNADVCEAIGWLQNFLLNTRPSVALGMVALVASSVAISTGLVFSQAVEIAATILSACHL